METPGPQTLFSALLSSLQKKKEPHRMLRYITASLRKPASTTLKCNSVIRPIKKTPCQFRTYATGKKKKKKKKKREREREDQQSSYCQT